MLAVAFGRRMNIDMKKIGVKPTSESSELNVEVLHLGR